MAIKLSMNRSKRSTSPYPEAGMSVDWAGVLVCARLSLRGLYLGIDGAPSSTTRRLKLLPRSSWELRYGDRQWVMKTVPALETLMNIRGTLNLQSVMNKGSLLLSEVHSPEAQYKKIRTRKSKVRKEAIAAGPKKLAPAEA